MKHPYSPWTQAFSGCFLLLFLHTSCVRHELDLDRICLKGHPQLGIPLAYSRMSAAEAIQRFDDNGLVSTGANGQLSIVYQSSTAVLYAGDVLVLPDQAFSESVSLDQLSGMLLPPGVGMQVEGSFLWELESPYGDRLDSVRFASGLAALQFTPPSGVSVQGVFQLRSVDDATVVLEFPIGTAQSQIQKTTFENLFVDFVNVPGIANGLRAWYSVELMGTGNQVAGELGFQFELTNLNLAKAAGYIAPRTIQMPTVGTAVHMFNNMPQYDVYAEQPRLLFFLSNGLGLGLSVRILELRATVRSAPTVVIDEDDIFLSPVLAPAAPSGESVLSTISVYNESIRPSLSALFNQRPTRIEGDMELHVNPDNLPWAFISNAANVSGWLEAEVPLYGSVANFELVDTVSLSLAKVVSEAEKAGYISGADIRLRVQNGLPVAMGVNVLFCDSLYQPLEWLFETTGDVVAAAPVNHQVPVGDPNHGRVTAPSVKVTDIQIPKSRLNDLTHAAFAVISVTGHTTSNGAASVRFFADDAIEVSLGANIHMSYEGL
jgi:hypothetical protein